MPNPSAIDTLTGIALPAHLAGRALPPLVRFRTTDEALRARYDSRTLLYSAVWLPSKGVLRLFGPKALNLTGVLRRAQYSTEVSALPPPRLRQFKRYTTLEFPVSGPVHRLTVDIDGHCSDMPILPQDDQTFAGLNTLYTMSQNNDPDWICDWLRYYHRHHGANALLLADNASTAYRLDDLAERVRSLDFIKALRIVSVPFLYGPSSAICRRASAARYLQSAIANTNRDAFLSRARAVVSCDIDELVVSNGRRSIFDACVDSRLGFVTMPGYWRFSKQDTGLPRHDAHVWRDPARANACPTKYAICPTGPVGQWSWMTHSLESLPRRWFSGAPDFWFAHCFGISTKWKEGRQDDADPETWAPDPDLQALLRP